MNRFAAAFKRISEQFMQEQNLLDKGMSDLKQRYVKPQEKTPKKEPTVIPKM
ncbi:hypothetical protein [Diaphorobacter aerolatus]|uniref:Uncharacterized protein n=1 Tax=Diaphorobacter aerolatus TaxID=1288495 RepID=A0A7H0GJ99_9BURK|nr:hypothetical protein [Diaphorobacter aerolatus]QNP48365.1 hypothetical protein H9K75_20820 [Diaphorobacter aerolatus]